MMDPSFGDGESHKRNSRRRRCRNRKKVNPSMYQGFVEALGAPADTARHVSQLEKGNGKIGPSGDYSKSGELNHKNELGDCNQNNIPMKKVAHASVQPSNSTARPPGEHLESVRRYYALLCLQNSQKRAEERIAILEREVGAKNSELSHAKMSEEQLNRTISSKDRIIDELTSKLEKMKGEADDEATRSRYALESITTNVASLRMQLLCKDRALQLAHSNVCQLTETNAKNVSLLNSTLHAVRGELDAAKAEAAQLKTEKTTLNSTIYLLRSQLSNKSDECKTLSTESARLQTTVRTLQVQTIQLNHQVSQLQQQLQQQQQQQRRQSARAGALSLDEFLDCDCTDLFNSLLDTQYNYDYRKVTIPHGIRMKVVNGVRFFPPYGCAKFALKATNLYGDDLWMQNDVPGSWPTAFHGTDIDVVRTIMLSREYKTGTRDVLQGRDGKIGFWASSDPLEALAYAKVYTHRNASYKAIFQVRIRPSAYEEHNPGAVINYRVVKPRGNVRTMAICIFKIGDPGPDGRPIQ